MSSKWQIVAITGVAALGLVIYFANKTPVKDSVENKTVSSVSKIDFLDEAKKMTSKTQLEAIVRIEDLAASATNSEQKILLLDSLVKLWDSESKPAASATYSEKLAEVSGKADDWYKAADRYLMSTRFVKVDAQKSQLYESATSCFQKSLKIDPSNLDSKAGLGVCMVESAGLIGQPPMQGIALLKEVVAKDSSHLGAQLSLGNFDVQSGQLDKAIKRFETIKRLNPNFNEVNLYLADTYHKMGDNANALKNLEVYKSKLNDPVLVAEVDKYINDLKNK